MAGEFPVATPSSGRKQWKIYRGPRKPFRLGSALGEDGCPDSHVMYAKQLLEEKCDDTQDQEENERLGVYWLLKASEQGHEEATEMLRRCLQTGQGITEHNISDVKSCLDMPLEEKMSRHAAREIFASLSQGEGYITCRQLSEELLRVQDGPSGAKKDAVLDQQPSGSCGVQQGRFSDGALSERVTEDMLVSAASRYARGLIPLVPLLPPVHIQLPNSPCYAVVAAACAPAKSVAGSCQAAVQDVATAKPSILASLTGCLLFTVYSLYGMDGVWDFVPSALYYCSLLIMLVTTCRIITNKWESKHFRQWSNLLVAWGGSGVNSNGCEWTYCLNHCTPYLLFFIALINHLAVIPALFPHLNIPYSELTILAAFTSVFLLLNFMWYANKLDFLVLFSFGVHVIARYPYELDPVVSKEWRFLDVHVPTTISCIIGTGVELCVKWRWWLYWGLVGLLVRMAARDRWRGIVTTLAPHLVCLAWWQAAVVAAGGATKYGLIRAGLGLSGALVLLPLTGLAALILPVAAVVRVLSLGGFPLPVTAGLGAAILLSALYHYYRQHQDAANHTSGISWPKVAVALGSLLILLSLGSGPAAPEDMLSWSEFRHACPPDPSNSAARDLLCSQLLGARISLRGSVDSSHIVQVHNPFAAVVSWLPHALQESVKCTLGEKYDCLQVLDGPCIASVPLSLQNKCHLNNWNRFEYEINLKLEGTGPSGWGVSRDEKVSLTGTHVFSNVTAHLAKGDRLWVRGTLISTSPLKVALLAITCVDCSPDCPNTTIVMPFRLEYLDWHMIASAVARSILSFFAPPPLPNADEA